jgi:hypothetical protein
MSGSWSIVVSVAAAVSSGKPARTWVEPAVGKATLAETAGA